MSKHYSPLRYPGGKAKLSKFLTGVIEKQTTSNKVIFVEPFAGGAGAALTLLFTKKVNKIIINDLDPAIFALWKVIVEDTDWIIRKIQRTEITISEWRKQQIIYNSKTADIRKLGFATFFLNRTNRSGIIEGGPIGGFEQSGEWKIDARFNKEGLIERLEAIKGVSDKISVKNLDGISLLKNIQNLKSYDDYFIFLDPPYIVKGQLLYLNHYQKKNHTKLANFLNTSILNWVMTYDDTPLVHELYANKSIQRFDIAHTAHSRKTGKEVFISPVTVGNKLKLK
jgi:DNA adenine methylase